MSYPEDDVLGNMVRIRMMKNPAQFQEPAQNSYKRNRMAYILKTCMWSDCEFTIDEKRLRAHKLVLACNSPVFESMFFGVLSTNKPVKIVDSSFEDFEILLEYCYTEQAAITSVEQAWNLIYLSKKYMIEGLEKLCDDYISINVTITNLMISFELSSMYDKDYLVLKLERQIFTFVKEVFYHTVYHPRLSTLTHFLRLDKQKKELHPFLLMGTVRWAYNECKKDIPCPTVSDIWDTMEEHDLVRYFFYLHHETCRNFRIFHGIEQTSEQKQTLDLMNEVFDCYLRKLPQNFMPFGPNHEPLYSMEGQGTFRMPPQKVRERLHFNQPLNVTHKITPSRDCVITCVQVSCVFDSKQCRCDILVQISDVDDPANKLERRATNVVNRFGVGTSTRVDFSDSVVTLKAKSEYLMNVFYLPREESEVVIYNLLPTLKTKTVDFDFDDNSYAVLLGLCFFPL